MLSGSSAHHPCHQRRVWHSRPRWAYPLPWHSGPDPARERESPCCRSKRRQQDGGTPPPQRGSCNDADSSVIQSLRRAFYASPEPFDDALPSQARTSPRPEVLLHLPIWSAATPVQPGAQVLLHVHMPHLVHMLDQVFVASSPPADSRSSPPDDDSAQSSALPPLPWRIGYLYQPSAASSPTASTPASSSGTQPAVSSEPSIGKTAGPQQTLPDHQPQGSEVGVLLEITRALRLSDGRLMVLASALSRFRVLSWTQHSPYPRADVALWPDCEEVAAARLTLTADHTPPTHESTQQTQQQQQQQQQHEEAREQRFWEAAHAAAVASASAWHAYEFHVPRSQAWPHASGPREAHGDTPAERRAESAALLASLAEAGVLDVLPLPGGSVAGAWPGLSETVDRAESVAGEAAAAVLQYLDEPLVSTSLDVSTSSDASTSSRSQHASNTDGPSDRIDSAPGRPLLLCDWRSNPTASSAAAQPQPTHTPQPAEQSSRDMSAQDALNVLEQTEISVWQELDTVACLALKAQERALSLPLGLLQCRPPHPTHTSQTHPHTTHTQPATHSAPVRHSTLQSDSGLGGASTGAGVGAGDVDTQGSERVIASSIDTQGSEGVGHWGAASEGLEAAAPREWPVWRRAQRLSHALSSLLSEAAHPERAQAFLEAPSTTERLRMVCEVLRENRARLSTRAMLRSIERRSLMRHKNRRMTRDPLLEGSELTGVDDTDSGDTGAQGPSGTDTNRPSSGNPEDVH